MRELTKTELHSISNASARIRRESQFIEDTLNKVYAGQVIDGEDSGSAPPAASKPPEQATDGDNAGRAVELNQLGKTPDGLTRRNLPWGKRVSTLFLDKVLWIEKDLGLTADNLMNCMAFETGRTFSPKVKNPGSSATGLIQFMEATARRLGTTTAALSQMTAEFQLNFVWKYFNDYADRMNLEDWNLGDTYMAILWPAGIGKPGDHPIFVQGRGNAYAVNRGLDVNRDGTVTRDECISKIVAMAKEGLAAGNYGYGSL